MIRWDGGLGRHRPLLQKQTNILQPPDPVSGVSQPRKSSNSPPSLPHSLTPSHSSFLPLSASTQAMADEVSKHGSEAVQLEKPTVETMEGSNPAAASAGMDPARRAQVEKTMKRKLDARCSLFVLIYIMNYLDRNNMAAARLKGLQEDLNMVYSEYATCLSILYVGYILMQVPSNIFINRIQRPSIYISLVMLLWGLISTLSGVVTNFSGMVAIRFFLGFVEAAFLPGALMILSKWYTRRELTVRNAILFCGNLISNAFSALVGAGVLSNMQGTLGHAAWRWLFWSKLLPNSYTRSRLTGIFLAS